MSVVIGIYAGNYVSDARNDKRKPSASVRGIMPLKEAKAFASHLMAQPGGEHVMYLALPWDTAEARYSLSV